MLSRHFNYSSCPSYPSYSLLVVASVFFVALAFLLRIAKVTYTCVVAHLSLVNLDDYDGSPSFFVFAAAIFSRVVEFIAVHLIGRQNMKRRSHEVSMRASDTASSVSKPTTSFALGKMWFMYYQCYVLYTPEAKLTSFSTPYTKPSTVFPPRRTPAPEQFPALLCLKENRPVNQCHDKTRQTFISSVDFP